MALPRTAGGLAAVVGLVVAGPVSPATAHGGDVGCGSVITRSTTLHHDLLGCAGTGLVIGADGITLDLGGHTLGADAVEDPLEVGVDVTGRHDVHITHGTVEGFYRGVVFESAPRAVATSLTVQHSTRRGIVLADGSDDGRVIGNNTSDNFASGIAVVASTGADVERNVSARNVSGAGVRLEGATRSRVISNRFPGDQLGLQLTDGADDDLVAGNSITDTVDIGLEQNFSDRAVIRDNVFVRSDGISLESSDDNVMVGNRLTALPGPDGIGIQVYGDRNLVAHTTVVHPVRYGIEVDDFGDPGHSPAVDNVIRDNTVVGGGLGIAIGPEAGGVVLRTVVDDNRVFGATGDGIQLLGPSTGLETSLVGDDLAVHNGGWGIAAVPGTTDLGGNRAAGNGQPGQCLNVDCGVTLPVDAGFGVK